MFPLDACVRAIHVEAEDVTFSPTQDFAEVLAKFPSIRFGADVLYFVGALHFDGHGRILSRPQEFARNRANFPSKQLWRTYYCFCVLVSCRAHFCHPKKIVEAILGQENLGRPKKLTSNVVFASY